MIGEKIGLDRGTGEPRSFSFVEKGGGTTEKIKNTGRAWATTVTRTWADKCLVAQRRKSCQTKRTVRSAKLSLLLSSREILCSLFLICSEEAFGDSCHQCPDTPVSAHVVSLQLSKT